MNQQINPFCDLEAEKAVLGAMLIDAAVIPDIVRLLGENGDAFYTTSHQLLYQQILQTYQRQGKTDPLLVADQLKKTETLNRIGGTDYLYELQAPIVETQSTSAYTEILLERWTRRQLSEASAQMKEIALDENISAEDAVNQSADILSELALEKVHKGLQPIRPYIIENIDAIEEASKQENATIGLTTGFSDFDEITSGLQPGQLIIIAARPSKGKTTLVLNIAQHIALNASKPVAFISLEMTGQEIAMRMLSAEAHIDYTKLRNGTLAQDQWSGLVKAMERLHNATFFVNDNMRGSVVDIRSEVRRLRDQHGQLAVIIIDYLQLMRGTAGKYNVREQEIADISRSLKALAAEMNVPIIACSQLNRNVEKRQGTPQLMDLRESGAIEQDADIVAFLHNEEEEAPQIYDRQEVELIIKKHRNGPTGTVVLYFNKKQMRFENQK